MLRFFIDHSEILVETLAIAVLFTVGSLVLPHTSRWLYNIERGLGRLARRRGLSVALIGLLGIGSSAALSLLGYVPEPGVHDEFSYLLAANTFARGRLSNPTHPLWVHFESFHIIQQPTYASKYPPAQGLILALGQVIGGHPIVGVAISMGLACASTYWMLLAWLPGWWAMLGATLAILHPGILSSWGYSYCGGAMAMMGGALVVGALRRVIRRPRLRDAVLLGLGLAILANSRPYEGFVMSLPIAIALLVWMLLKKGPPAVKLVKCVGLPIFLVLVLTCGVMAFYNLRVTGNVLSMPYFVHESTYAVAPVFLWQQLRPQPAYRHQVLEKFHAGLIRDSFTAQLSITGLLRESVAKLDRLWRFYQGFRPLRLMLTIPLLMLPWVLKSRWLCFAILTCGLLTVGLLMETWVFPHYAAPITGLVFVITLQGMRYLRLWRWRGRPMGQVMMWTLVVVAVASFAVAFVHQVQMDLLASWQYNRARMLAQLKGTDGRHLVIVRYGPLHSPHLEWVYNEADIDNAKVIWARDMDAVQNRRLLEYFKDRHVWLVEVDDDVVPPELMPFPVKPHP
jgi:hypothetical protein